MAIRYVDRWDSPALKPVSDADCFAFRIDSIDDYNVLPTPTVPADVVEGDGTISLCAGVGSEVLSQDQTIIGELQSDGEWHRLGVS